jgi:hypothetical protein
MILNFYVGNSDWPHRNWYAGRNREGDQGFQFYPWDTETALSNVNADRTGVDNAVARPYGALRANATFRQQFGDHVYRHITPGGALYVNPQSPKWDPAASSERVGFNKVATLGIRSSLMGLLVK